jgi:hypothetical protein
MRGVHLLTPASHGRTTRLRLLVGMATRNPARTIYGTIVATSVLAVESALRTELGDLLLTELVTVIVYWLAHVYADYAAQPPEPGRRAALARLTATAAHEWSLVTASFVPMAAVLAVAAAGGSTALAATGGLWTGVAMLFGWGVAAARDGGRSRRASLAFGGVSSVFGLTLIALKALLH